MCSIGKPIYPGEFADVGNSGEGLFTEMEDGFSVVGEVFWEIEFGAFDLRC